jgi:surface carbohydrate biosynthesis protein (TIGR04326 family)
MAHPTVPGEELIVWDATGDPPANGPIVYRWEGHAEEGSVLSLLRYVELHGERLRRQYLEWIHDLGESRISRDGARVIDRLRRGDGLSYWWMTTLVEQSLIYKSPGILDAIRLLALEEILLERRPRMVRLVSANTGVHYVLRDLCGELGISYARERPGSRRRQPLTLRRLFRSMPAWCRAVVVTTRDIGTRWPLRRAPRSGEFAGKSVFCFISYFFHLDVGACRNGTYRSHYWAQLPETLLARGCQTNWIQHYIRSAAVPSTAVALDWTSRFNEVRAREGHHTFVDAYLSWNIVVRVIVGWLRLVVLSVRLRGIRRAFRPSGSHVSLWPVLRGDWIDSMRGPAAVNNLLMIEMFETAMRSLPHQPTGLYLCENQGWERAMIHAWRKHGHGRLIAVAHSTIRFWDLRYFTDPRTLRDDDPHPIPRADVMVLNGNAQLEAYRTVAYPHDAIAVCESLRFGYLRDWAQRVPADPGDRDHTRVLVLGDYSAPETNKMLQLLMNARASLPTTMTFTLKPHPGQAVDATQYAPLNLMVVQEPLGRILGDFDVVCSSNSTSAAVDAYLAGVPLVVILDDTQFNFSPLRGRSDVRFVATPAELAAGLSHRPALAVGNALQDEFFLLDPKLPRWKRLLGVDDPIAA